MIDFKAYRAGTEWVGSVLEFIDRVEDDIDVYDDYCEDICIAWCAGLKLTDKGKEVFSDVLGMTMEILDNGNAIVHVAVNDDRETKKRLCRAKYFFLAAAGYCSYEEYEEWFEDGEF